MAYNTLAGEDNAKKAVELLDMAIKYKDDYFEAYFNKGCILMRLGEYIDAIQIFNKCKELKPEEATDECEAKIKECGNLINNGGEKPSHQEEVEEEEEINEEEED